jgi:carboxymethylenebutenolidase
VRIQGRRVELAGHGGAVVQALLHEPEPHPGGQRPGILLVHDVHGLDKPVQDLAARLAHEGFAVLAPDLWSRGGMPGPRWDQAHPAPEWSDEELRAGVDALDDRRVLADLEAGLARLAAVPCVDRARLGALGLGHGGTFALMLGCTSRRLAAVVLIGARVRYPALSRAKPSQPLELALNLGCPVLAAVGEGDPATPPADVEALRETLGRFARELELVGVASEALASELRRERPGGAAEEALERAIAFLHERLESA